MAAIQLQACRKVFETGAGINDEMAIAFGGETHWFLSNNQPILDPAGNVVLVMMNALDITDKKLAEQEIQRMGRYYQSLIEKAPDGFVLISEQGKFGFISPAARRMLGYAGTDLLSDDPGEFTHPDDMAEVVGQLGRIIQDPSYSPTLQYRFRHKDGSWRWIESTFINHLADPDLRAIVINFRDITQRRQTETALYVSEALFSGIFHSSPIAISMSDLDSGKWREVNKAFLKLTGYTRKEIIGHNFLDIKLYKNPDDREKLMSILNERGKVSNYEIEINRKNGETATVLVALEKLDIFGQVSLLTIASDITDRKNAEAEIYQLNQQLEERVINRTTELRAANQEMEAFTYSVSHDLRAPLRGINGFVEILMEDYAVQMDEEGQRICKIIRDNSRKMSDLIDDLLAFSRLSRTGMSVSSIRMNELVWEVFREVGESVGTASVDFRIGDLPDVRADKTMIRQVWANLLSNAVKYSSTRENPKIEVSGQIEGDKAVYSVSDNGVGFDMKYKDKLFGVFQRLHSPKEFSGTGVGLAIVERIVSRHGGEVSADGKVDKGATFCFSLPLEPELK